MSGPHTSDMVPTRYDVILDGYGYVFADNIEPNLPFRSHKATYTISPTFIDRSNVTGVFGDNQQDFWLTASQNDWSLGEEQKFYRATDQTSRSRYWRGMSVDLSVQGQIGIGKLQNTFTATSAIRSMIYHAKNQLFYFATDTELFSVSNDGYTTTRLGSHGASYTPSLAIDGSNVYISGTSGGALVRKWNGSAFSTFSSTVTNPMVYANNTLYGFNSLSSLNFMRYDSAGTATGIYTWKNADGNAYITGLDGMVAYGSKIAIFLRNDHALELWIFDGTSTTKVAEWQANFNFGAACTSEGILFFVGQGQKLGFSRCEVRYFANGTTGLAYASQWANVTSNGDLGITPFGSGVLFTDHINQALMYYDLAAGGASTVAKYTQTSGKSYLASSDKAVLEAHVANSAYYQSFASTTASSASVHSSLFDFDSSLNKYVRAVKVDFDSAPDGNGGSVDLYYTLNDVVGGGMNGSLVSIASSVTSGTEYPINQTCHSIGIMAVLNLGTSTNGPILKRIYVRAAPSLQQFRRREYIFDLSGDATETDRELRDGAPQPASGRDQANRLASLANSTAPFTIVDRFGSFTGIVDLNDAEGFELYEIHPSTTDPRNTGTFVARVKVREV